MLAQKPPIRVIIPGRTYRSDSDQTHTPMFHQVEGLVIDKGAHLGHLKWILEEFCKAFFEVDTSRCASGRRSSRSPSRRSRSTSSAGATRARCASARARTGWRFSAAAWCIRTCCSNCGLDPDEYQGFAWGMGIDRIAMLKYGMPDLRAFFEADVRWLAHYGFRPLDLPTLAGGLSDLTSKTLMTMAKSHAHCVDAPKSCGFRTESPSTRSCKNACSSWCQ